MAVAFVGTRRISWKVGLKMNANAGSTMLNLNSSVDFSRRDAEAQRMLDICVVLSFRPKQDGFANLHLVGEKH